MTLRKPVITLAEITGATVGIATSVRSDELAGPAVMVTGIAAVPGADRDLAPIFGHLSEFAGGVPVP